MESQTFQTSTIQELNSVCEYLKLLSTQEKIFLFSGEMGAGKTTLIKQLCFALGVEDEVSSPTFSLVNEYQATSSIIYHFDLYRIKSEEELYDIGYEDYFFSGYLCLVEWPEKASELIPQKHIMVTICVENDQRTITVTHHE